MNLVYKMNSEIENTNKMSAKDIIYTQIKLGKKIILVNTESTKFNDMKDIKLVQIDKDKEIINPLQIYSTIKGFDIFSFGTHLKKIRRMYCILVSEYTEEELTSLDILLTKFYEYFGIDIKDCTKYKENEYPILSDFINYLRYIEGTHRMINCMQSPNKEKVFEVFKELNNIKDILNIRINVIDTIISKLNKIIDNYGYLLNIHSNTNHVHNSEFIVFNKLSLFDDEKILGVLLINILTFINENYLFGEKNAEYLIVFDNSNEIFSFIKTSIGDIITSYVGEILNTADPNFISFLFIKTKMSAFFNFKDKFSLIRTQNIEDFLEQS
ncbi:Uncharacterised protein [Clostridioides difficile]|uniref:hypothetical protein n=1 Tax=Clostridioides difficile TaxID=1496 RepID=UPI001025403A|nr:hypothetical protein [Clostridioides difficile]VFF93613.1 Uncharacterised protein [Clostridioides difficile]VIG04079.1 Uncharacterised protein [Clostridioides difficile]HBF4772006.1 hypothetical protein [Clostridioides difficile]HBF5037935.1 hypothetical protein [Clostridioides difficile]HBF5410660.1 hypothetical protein [Clostridioides difficile]